MNEWMNEWMNELWIYTECNLSPLSTETLTQPADGASHDDHRVGVVGSIGWQPVVWTSRWSHDDAYPCAMICVTRRSHDGNIHSDVPVSCIAKSICVVRRSNRRREY